MGRRTGIRSCWVLAAVGIWLLSTAAPAMADTLQASPTTFAATEGQTFNGAVASFSDSPDDDLASQYTATINWGDGVTTPGVIGRTGVTPWTVSGTHAFAEEGTYRVTVSVSDTSGSGAADTLVETEQVADAPLRGAAAGAPSAFSGTGTGGATNSLNAFEAAIGGANNGATPAEQASGFRRVSWDDVRLDGGDPGSTVISAGKTVAIGRDREQLRGLTWQRPLAVSGDGFVSVNPLVAGPLRFPPFTPANVAAPFNTNVAQMNVVAPATPLTAPLPQATRGVGVIFLNVRQPNTTSVEYLSGDAVLSKQFAPAGVVGAPSFVGAVFPQAVVTSVRITFGTAPIFSFGPSGAVAAYADLTENLVAADDVVLAEPAPLAPDLAAVAGVPLTQRLDSFVDTNPFETTAPAFSAAIDWGDGSVGAGTLTPGSGGAFDVSAAHTYAAAGSFPVTVTVQDAGGSQRVTHFTAHVAPRTTTTAVRCSPASLVVSTPSRCTATVSDTAPNTLGDPTGTVAFSANPPGAAFASGAGCVLLPAPDGHTATCSTTYTPGRVGTGRQQVLATYGGDSAHAGSAGTASLTVRPHGCALAVPQPKLGRTHRLVVTVTCDGAESLRLTVIAKLAHGATLTFGSARGRARANRGMSLSVKPGASVLRRLRAAARAHRRITLTLKLVASASTTVNASATVRSLQVS